MNRHKCFLIRLILLALVVAMASPALAEKTQERVAQGNNVGLFLGLYLNLYRGWAVPHQFPRGSGNIIKTYGITYGPCATKDLDGDGVAEDTTTNENRGKMFDGCRASLEAYDQIEALWNAGENLFEATGRIEMNRVWSSLDDDDLADWPAEFREGRTASGAPILHGKETVVRFFSDVYLTDRPTTGASLESSTYLLNFGESNNMVYGHLFMRNMSEYLKWNYLEERRSAVAKTPNGQPWETLVMGFCTHNFAFGGSDEGWIYHPAKRITGFKDLDGLENSFSPNETPVFAQKVLRLPSYNGETMDMTNNNISMGSEFGFDGQLDVIEQGFSRGKAFRAYLGEPYSDDLYPGQKSPWTGKQLYGWPGLVTVEDGRYDQWLWGRIKNSTLAAYGTLHDIPPRDTLSMDFVLMFVPVPHGGAYQTPPADIGNIDDPGMQEYLQPVENYAEVAQTVFEGGYILPETPAPPPLTIIPGDRQVTITWSDVNVQTPDNYYYFLQEHPDLDPNGFYREYDLEGFRLYRSFVGPSDSHSELIYECSLSENNLSFFFIDKLEDDTGLFRMKNGAKVWYALVPYDRNYDPATGEMISLPNPTSGKTWNRPGEGLYTVIPRSEASNFRSASLLSISYVPVSASTTVVSAASLELSGDGSGRLTEAPKYLEPQVSVVFVPVNSERITQDITAYMACSSMQSAPALWYECRWYARESVMQLQDASGKVVSEPAPLSVGVNDDVPVADVDVLFQSPVDADGINYALEATFKNLHSYAHYEGGGSGTAVVYADLDAGAYDGATISIPIETPCAWSYQIGSRPSNAAFLRSGVLEVAWKAVGDDLTIEVVDKTHGITIPFGLYPDADGQNVWGFMPAGTYGDFWDETGSSPEDRSVRMLDKIPADNTDEFAFWLNGLVWVFSEITSMPSPGTWTITNAMGTWNEDYTVFTQWADAPYPGDKWEIKIKAMSQDPEDADLSKVRVVPNPYLGSSFLDLSPSSRRIEFVNLPDRCTIRIFTLSGNLVNVLNHIGANRHGWGNYKDYDRLSDSQPREFTGWDNHGGTEPWNLRNRFGATVASGLYFYHVTDTRGKTYTGKFYVVN